MNHLHTARRRRIPAAQNRRAERTSGRISPSVAHGVSLARKLSEGRALLGEYRDRARDGYEFQKLFADVAQYEGLLRAHAGISLQEARVFEIGFGARPHRQLILQSMGIDARGVDAEVPVLSGRPSEFVAMARRNALERGAKSLVRFALFDSRERTALNQALARHGLLPRLDPARLVVADAGALELEAGSVDLIFSEDVFEHIARDTLQALVPKIARWLRPGGVALIRPNIYTGITGGHLLEWSRRAVRDPHRRRNSEPWEHLRRRRVEANTHLNRMTRADYRRLFASSFVIHQELVTQPDLGRAYLDERARAELAQWPDEELFSNQTLFVLGRRPGG
jgi:SAM-dependent methyltransferase